MPNNSMYEAVDSYCLEQRFSTVMKQMISLMSDNIFTEEAKVCVCFF